MFELVYDYPMAITAASGPDRTAVELALEWLRRTTYDVGGQPLAYAPNRPALREWPILTDLNGWAAVTTWRSMDGWSGGSVLAASPDADHLALITDDPRTRALCVVPWLEKDVTAWVRAYRPVTLPPTLAVATRDPELISDPVVVRTSGPGPPSLT